MKAPQVGANRDWPKTSISSTGIQNSRNVMSSFRAGYFGNGCFKDTLAKEIKLGTRFSFSTRKAKEKESTGSRIRCSATQYNVAVCCGRLDFLVVFHVFFRVNRG